MHRRSLYTFWKRTVPHPQMTTFDAADRSTCTARRQPTSTPLHALAMLNDVQMAEAARFLGMRLVKSGVGEAFRSVTGRKPTERESKVLQRMLQEQKEEFEKDPAAMRKWLAVGDAKPGEGAELAAAAAVALAILNHDEAMTRR